MIHETLTRVINLRQLDCVQEKDAPDLFNLFPRYISENIPKDWIAIALTHDCSIAAEKISAGETHIEFIVAKPIEHIEDSYVGARNPRKLHIPVLINSQEKHYELNIVHRCFIDKSSLFDVSGSPHISIDLEIKERIKDWMAARYRAPAYPNTFNDIFKKGKKSPQEKITKILKENNELILNFDLYLCVESGADNDLPYEIRLIIITKSNLDEEMKSKICQIRDKIKDVFSQVNASDLELIGDCIHIYPSNEITLDQFSNFDLLYMEYLSDRVRTAHEN